MMTTEEMIGEVTETAKGLSPYGVLKLMMVSRFIRDQERKEKEQKEQARLEAKELKEAAINKEWRIRVLETAVKKLEPSLAEAREKATENVVKAIRPEHEAAALKIVELQRQLNAALEEEQEICQFLHREVGSDVAVVPVYRMMGYANKWGKVQPGREDDQNSTFYRIITRLRERGYKV